MSYCVHCGVELHKTAKSCPLCNTPVLNPTEPADRTGKKPWPDKSGQVDSVRHTDTAILVTVILASSALSCGLLNLLVFRSSLWSFYVIGACILLWIFCIPFIIYTKLKWYASIIIDGIFVGLYCGIIHLIHPGKGWYFGLALPIILLITIIVLALAWLFRKCEPSILSRAIYVVGGTAFLCVGIEILIRRYLEESIYITWSAVVFVSCLVISLSLFTITKRARLREEVRRRMHI